MGGGRLGPPLQVGPPQLPQGCALLWAGLSACRCRGRSGSEVWGLPFSPRLWVLLGWGVVLESQGVSHHSVDPVGQLTVHRQIWPQHGDLLGGPGKALRDSHHMEPLRLGDDGESFAEKQSRFSLTKSSKQTGDSWEASQSCIRYLVLCNK